MELNYISVIHSKVHLVARVYQTCLIRSDMDGPDSTIRFFHANLQNKGHQEPLDALIILLQICSALL